MAKIPQDFINNIGFLYESISLEEKDFMNEESEYYDAEAVEIVEELISTISLSMICEGYSASSIISFLKDSSDQNIIEKYLNFDENLIVENSIPEEYILEQIEILEQVSNLIIEKRGIARALQGLKGLFSTAKRAPALKSAGPLSANAATRLAMKGKPTLLQKAKVGTERLIGPKGRKAVQAVRDFGSKAKAALPTVAKTALVGGLGVLGGYGAAKLLGGGDKGVSNGPKKEPSGSGSRDGVVKDYTAFRAGGGGAKSRQTGMNIRDVEALGRKNLAALKAKGGTQPAPSGGGGGGRPSGGGGGGRPSGGGGSKPPATTPTKPEDKGPAGETPMQKWARLHPNLASKVKPGQSGYDEISATRIKPGPNEKQDQTPTQGPKTTPTQDKDLAQQSAQATKEVQDREKKKLEQKTATITKESYDAFDIVLEYLTSEGHVDTLDEAVYVMMEMDSETIQSICEAKSGKWIQKAIKHPGALSKQLGVPEEENIPAGKLEKAAKAKGKKGQRARLAKTLKGLNKE